MTQKGDRMTEKQRMIKKVAELNGKTLIELALRIGALELVDVELDVVEHSAREIKEALIDMGVIKG